MPRVGASCVKVQHCLGASNVKSLTPGGSERLSDRPSRRKGIAVLLLKLGG